MKIGNRFMRIILMFDLPTETSQDLKNYRDFVKYLKIEGFIRVQYSVYSKLCINHDAAQTAAKRLRGNTPLTGDVRYMIVTERQYLNIVNVNNVYSFQEKMTTADRTLFIGGLNSEDSL